MKAKFLLALDGSDASMRAAQYVANLLENQTDVLVTLFHVLLPIPPSLLEGGIDTDSELKRQRAMWVKDEQSAECQLFAPVREIFRKAGFHDRQIQTRCLPSVNEPDVAHAILKESEEGGYDTVVVGRRGRSRIRIFLTGSVTEKIVRHARACAVWVIE
jgi:nucleotide-binding universal stress UspA family protein